MKSDFNEFIKSGLFYRFYLVSFTVGKLKMEDDLTFLLKWNTTSIFLQMEYNDFAQEKYEL